MKTQKKKKPFEWGYLLLLPGLGYILFFILLAVYRMTAQSFGFYNYMGESHFTLEYWQGVFERAFFDDLWFSFRTAILTAFISIVICYILSFLLQVTPGRKVFLSLLKVPMFIPGLVASFLIVNIIDYQGIVNLILIALHLIDEPLQLRNDAAGVGALAVQIWKNIPFQLIIMYSAIDAVRKDVKDAARNLGANQFQLITQIVLPISLPSALVAVIMVFIRTFNDFAIAKTAGPLYPTSISNLMYLHAYTFGEWNAAACIGVMMMATSIVFVAVYTYIAKKIAEYT